MISGISSGGYSPAMLSSACSGSAKPDLAQLQESLFSKIDANGDGGVDATELGDFVSALSSGSGTEATGSEELFAALDSSGDGSVSLDELKENGQALFDQLREQMMSSQLGRSGGPGMGPPPPPPEDMFASIDSNDDGSIDKTELSSFLEQRASESTGTGSGPSVEEIFASDDADGDELISASEFEAAMESRHAARQQDESSSESDSTSAMIAAILRQYQSVTEGTSATSQISVAA